MIEKIRHFFGTKNTLTLSRGVSSARRDLTVESVSKHFGGVYALRNVSMTCRAGEIVGLIGPNGAGKSTLLNVISGVIVSDAGAVMLGDENLTHRKPAACAIAGIGRTFQNIRLFELLSVRQNVEVSYATCAMHRPERVEEISVDGLLDQLGLLGDGERLSSELSYGHQRRLEIARAVALGCDVLLLDEPAAGMNQRESDDLIHSVRDIRDAYGCGVIVIDHDMRFIMTVCERITVLHLGEKIAEGSPTDIQNNPAVIEVYMGSSADDPDEQTIIT